MKSSRKSLAVKPQHHLLNPPPCTHWPYIAHHHPVVLEPLVCARLPGPWSVSSPINIPASSLFRRSSSCSRAQKNCILASSSSSLRPRPFVRVSLFFLKLDRYRHTIIARETKKRKKGKKRRSQSSTNFLRNKKKKAILL
jgi:hypothetical protein